MITIGANLKIDKETPYPSADMIRVVQDSIKGVRPDVPDLVPWHESYISNHINRIAFDLQIIRNLVPLDSRVLEVGCIPLMLTSSLSKLGYTEVTGVDIAPERYGSSLRNLRLHVIKCDIENGTWPFDSASFDAVICFEVFEHLRINLKVTAGELARVLKPGGTLLLSSPNLRSLEGIENFLFRNRAYSCIGDIFEEYDKLDKLGHMGHVREYTTTEVVIFLRKMGFEVTKLIFRENYRGLSRLITKLFPSLRPFVTYVARKHA